MWRCGREVNDVRRPQDVLDWRLSGQITGGGVLDWKLSEEITGASVLDWNLS